MKPLVLLGACLGLGTLFVMAEMALASANRARLARRQAQGDAGAAAALRLLGTPALFLSTVQVGITFTGVAAAIFAGSELSVGLAEWMSASTSPWVAEHSLVVAEGVVSFAIGSVTIVFAEILPKRIAMTHAETLASWLSRPMIAVSWITYPLVGTLSWTAETVLRLFGLNQSRGSEVSEDELRMMVETGHATGELHAAEKRIMLGAMDLDLVTAAHIMTPARKIVWMDLRLPDEENWRRIIRSGHTWFPAHRDSPDELAGVVSVKRLWANLALTGKAAVKDQLTEAAAVPPQMTGSALLAFFQDRGQHVAIVADDFGRTLGIVSINDILERLVGSLPADLKSRRAGSLIKRADGSWLADGDLAPRVLRQELGLAQELPCEGEPGCGTLAGLVMKQRGGLPAEGEVVALGEIEAEVADLDATRIDKLVIRRRPPAQ
jgi:putative hemolysin